MTQKAKHFLELVEDLDRKDIFNNFAGLYHQFQAVKSGYDEFNTV